jgi:hypothetical protein
VDSATLIGRSVYHCQQNHGHIDIFTNSMHSTIPVFGDRDQLRQLTKTLIFFLVLILYNLRTDFGIKQLVRLVYLFTTT